MNRQFTMTLDLHGISFAELVDLNAAIAVELQARRGRASEVDHGLHGPTPTFTPVVIGATDPPTAPAPENASTLPATL